jgi:hypothetical protein
VIGFECLALIFYRLLLFGYPPEFRAEFGVEMQIIFRMAIEEGQQSDKTPITLLLWWELRDWPTAVLREHLRVRRHKMSTNGFVDVKPLSLKELLAALVIFLLPLMFVIVSISVFPEWYGSRNMVYGTTKYNHKNHITLAPIIDSTLLEVLLYRVKKS